MITKSSQHIWTYRALFLGLCLIIITAKILPITLDQGRLPSPDILLAVTLAWLLRQPSAVPVLSIVIVFLLADFLLQRPPGLWTLLVLLVSEGLRRKRAQMTEIPFLVEWGLFAVAVFALILMNRIALFVLFAETDRLGIALAHGIVTVGIYPVVVALSKYGLGLRKLRPTETESKPT